MSKQNAPENGTNSPEEGAKHPEPPVATDQTLARARKKRSDAGIPKAGFMVLVTKEDGRFSLIQAEQDNELSPITPQMFHSVDDLTEYMGHVAKLGETYQPVVPLGPALALKQAVMVV